MKKIIYIGMFVGLLAAACQENEMDGFESDGAVYFQLNSQWSNTVDSIVYSFAGKAEEAYTVKLQVNLMGVAVDYDRSVRLVVDHEHTTAKENVHYEALLPSYTLLANAYKIDIPIVLYGSDPELEERAFRLTVRLEASEDLQLGLSKRTVAKVIFSKQNTIPVWWNMDFYGFAFGDYLFGAYSKVKHEHFMLELGKDFPGTYDELMDSSEEWQVYSKHMNNYFIEHYPIYDENGYAIEPWSEE